jgi:uncharacterized repeat protein (TIGR03803 family)
MSAIASRFTSSASVLLTVLLFCTASFGQVETVLYSFLGGTDGANPDSGLVADSAGNLYGGAGSYPAGNGVVFELSPPTTAGDPWTKRVIHQFAGSPTDGYGLAFLTPDNSGNLFGTTFDGGTNGKGIVFELSPPATAGDPWTETVLYNFPEYTSGKASNPNGRLTFDGAGNLYGAAFGGIGDCFLNGCGVVFQIKKPNTPGGTWRGRVIYAFGAFSGDATVPWSGFVFRSGVLYGTSTAGGANGQGTLFELSQTDGVWSETILHSFTSAEGSQIMGNLISDTEGSLYTVAYAGGEIGYGSVIELSPPADLGGTWRATNLHSFTYGNDGGSPQGGVIRDKNNNLYGTSTNGAAGDYGTVFKLIPPAVAAGAWTEKTLYVFGDHPFSDGAEPFADLILINGKGLFGTTHYGGTSGNGTIFNLKP